MGPSSQWELLHYAVTKWIFRNSINVENTWNSYSLRYDVVKVVTNNPHLATTSFSDCLQLER